MNTFRNLCIAASVPVLALVSSVASATEPPTVDEAVVDALGDLATKVGTYAAAFIALAVVGTGIAIGVKYIKKGRGAA
jgi:hypothetical protein